MFRQMFHPKRVQKSPQSFRESHPATDCHGMLSRYIFDLYLTFLVTKGHTIPTYIALTLKSTLVKNWTYQDFQQMQLNISAHHVVIRPLFP